jgi:hypothetical protein
MVCACLCKYHNSVTQGVGSLINLGGPTPTTRHPGYSLSYSGPLGTRMLQLITCNQYISITVFTEVRNWLLSGTAQRYYDYGEGVPCRDVDAPQKILKITSPESHFQLLPTIILFKVTMYTRHFFNYITGGGGKAPMVSPPFSLIYKQNMEFRRVRFDTLVTKICFVNLMSCEGPNERGGQDSENAISDDLETQN